MLSVGDRATGVPANPNVRRNYPTITGVYDQERVDNGDIPPYTVQYVVIEDGQIIDCSSVRPASRRDKVTRKVVAS